MVDDMQALRTGLQLARASQLTMLRLQLAFYGSNRRVAMQAVDDLLDLDAEIEDLAATLTGVFPHPADDADLPKFIGNQKAAIAAEKHAVTGGDGRNNARSIAIAAPGDWTSGAELSAQPPLSDDEAGIDRTGSRRWHVLAGAITIIFIGFGLIAYMWPALPADVISSWG
jgi:hypothetical protein